MVLSTLKFLRVFARPRNLVRCITSFRCRPTSTSVEHLLKVAQCQLLVHLVKQHERQVELKTLTYVRGNLLTRIDLSMNDKCPDDFEVVEELSKDLYSVNGKELTMNEVKLEASSRGMELTNADVDFEMIDELKEVGNLRSCGSPEMSSPTETLSTVRDDDSQGKAKRKNQKKSSNWKKKKTTLRGNNVFVKPNYFVAIKISNQQIRDNLKSVQSDLLETEPLLKSAIVPVETAHVTLLVMHLQDENEVQRALDILKKTCDEHRSLFSEMTAKLDFAELGHFNNKVLFAKILAGVAFTASEELAESLRKNFESEKFNLSGNKKFNAHLTICKMSKDPQLWKKGVKKIPKESYIAHEEDEFGSQEVFGVQLCSMVDPKDESGYYHVCDEYLFRCTERQEDPNSDEGTAFSEDKAQ